MQRQLIAIERTVGLLSHLRLQTEPLAELRQQARVRDALSSVQIEGNSLSYEQAFELAERARQSGETETFGDGEREFLNYLCAFEQIEDLRGARDYRPSSGDLLNLHRAIVSGVRGGARYAGKFRSEEVKVGDIVNGETIVHHAPPHWGQVEEEVNALLSWINRVAKRTDHDALKSGAPDEWVHPVVIAGVAQHRLAWIHPFVDGNGRTARIFTALCLYYRSYDFKYLFDLSTYYNEERDAYYEALRATDQSGDYTPWLEYFMGGFAKQMYEIGQTALQSSPALSEDATK